MSSEENISPSRENKKRKNSSGNSPHDLVEATDENEALLVSPKKRNRIPKNTRTNTCITEGNRYIGSILTLPEVREGIICDGEVKNVTLICTVTDNRIGRTVGSESERSGFRFISIADCTGFLSVGFTAIEVGIRKYDTDNVECTTETRNFFNAIVTGNIRWTAAQSRQEHPVFFLNKGSIEKIELDIWSGDNRLMLPTTDICKQMVKSKYGGIMLLSTTGICGRVDWVREAASGVLEMSLEDPVGYSVIEIHPARDNETAKSLMQDNDIVEGTFLFIKGQICICNFPQHENARLKMRSTEVNIAVISLPRYSDYVKDLREIDASFFKDIVPEDMEW